MSQQKLKRVLGVGGVVLRPARRERASVASERRRLHGEQHEDVVFEQRRDDRSLCELQANGDARTVEALAQLT
jgi:hypothetical protein